MQTRALKTLVEIDKVGSFVKAAGGLNMTLSAVSMQMKALETDLGATLFDRTFRPPRLTPLGRSICDQAKRMLAMERDLREACVVGDALTGRFRIGFVPTASVRLLPTFLHNARQVAPAVEFEVVTGLSAALETQVREADLDFAVVTASVGDPALEYHVLREEVLAFAAPPEPALDAPQRLVNEMPFLHFMPSSGIGKLIAQHTEAFAGRGRGHMVLDSVEAIMECVNRGLGFTLLPEPDIERYAASTVRVFPAKNTALSRRLALVGTQSNRSRAQAEALSALFASPADGCA